jgi:hypothetical protein
MTLSKGLGHTAGCLSDHLQMVDHPDLEHLVGLKGIDAAGDPFFDFRGGFEDIASGDPRRSS